MASKKDVREALEQVLVPGVMHSPVSLNLVREITVFLTDGCGM